MPISDTNVASPASILQDISERFAKANLQLCVRVDDAYYASRNGYGGGIKDDRNENLPDIGCIQTVFEGLVTYYLSNSGVLAPTAPLSEYISEFAPAGHVGRSIKIEHLLSHSTGFHAPPSFSKGGGFKSWDDLLAFFATTPATFPPGSVSSMNSLSRNLLHVVLERTTGRSVYDLVTELIFRPNKIPATYVNTECGWPALLFPPEDLSKMPHILVGDLLLGDSLYRALNENALKVVKGICAPRGTSPVSYSWGVASFSDGTWGLNSNMVPKTAGFRFSKKDSFSVALSMDGNSMIRDLVIQYLVTSLSREVPDSNTGLMGSLFDCDGGEISGVYIADTFDTVIVNSSDEKINIKIVKDRETVAEIELSIKDGRLIYGNGRWDSLQIEFFKHPSRNATCMLMGQIVYVKN